MKIPAAALASLLLAMSHVSMAKEEVVAPTDDSAMDLEPVTASPSTSFSVEIVGKHDTRFKVFPCGKKDRKSSEVTTGGPKAGKPADDDVMKDGCKSDDRFMLVSIDHVREIGADGKIVPNRRVENLRNRALTTTIDGNKIQWKLGMDKNLLQDRKGICRDVTADSALIITAEIIESSTTVQNGVGTFKVAKDSLKWSFEAIDWPFCNGSTSLDIATVVRSRAPKGKKEPKDRSIKSEGKSEGKEGASGKRGKQGKQEADESAEVVLDESSFVAAPLSAVVNGDTNVAVDVTADVKVNPEWTVAEVTYSLPSGVEYANGTWQFADKIYYDPAISFNSAAQWNALTPAQIGGIAGGCAGVLLLGALGVVACKKRRAPEGAAPRV